MLPSVRENQSDWQQLLVSLGELYVRGVEIDWEGFDKDYKRRKVVLPTYPFQRQRYWVDVAKKRQETLRPLIDKMTKSPLIKETIFETEFSVHALPFLTDHQVYGTVVSPGACQLAMALNAAELILGKGQSLCLKDVILPQPLVIPNGKRTVQVVCSPLPALDHGCGPKYEFKLISFDPQAESEEARTHVTGILMSAANSEDDQVELAALRQRCDQPIDVASLYTAMEQIELGPSFRWIAEVWQGLEAREMLGKLYVPDAVGTVRGHLLHPGLLDACFQVASIVSLVGGETMLPFAVGALYLYRPAEGHTWWCHVIEVDSYKWNIRLLDEQGGLIAAIDGFEMRAASP